MGVIITKEDLQAYTEVDYIINHMNERYIKKLPKRLVEFFSTMKLPDYNVNIEIHKPLNEQGLKKYTLEIIALLHVKYWCSDEARKQELMLKMKENQDKFEKQLQETFSKENILEEKTEEDNMENPAVSKRDPVIKSQPIQTEEKIDENKNSEELIEKETFGTKIKKFFLKIFGKKS